MITKMPQLYILNAVPNGFNINLITNFIHIYNRALHLQMFSSMKLTPTTLLGKEESKKIKTIIQSILDKPESFEFQKPVDWKTLGLTDYTFIIKNPMDLGTAGEKLRNQKYRFVEEALDDIQLVWDNCKSYNHPDTWIYKDAENLERIFKKMIKNYLPSIPITVPGRYPGNGKSEERRPIQNNLFEEQENDDEVPYHQKMKFQQKLKHLSPKDLGIIVDIIIQKCPSAFEQQGGQLAQLYLDNLDLNLFSELSEMVKEMNDDYEDKLLKKVKE